MNLKFKSSEPDLKFKTQVNKLDIINGNILYLTREIDDIKRILTELSTDKSLQKQVDDYFEETSPQTESGEQ